MLDLRVLLNDVGIAVSHHLLTIRRAESRALRDHLGWEASSGIEPLKEGGLTSDPDHFVDLSLIHRLLRHRGLRLDVRPDEHTRWGHATDGLSVT